MRLTHSKSRTRNRQHGFTLVEILIALLIGLFLLGALFTIVQTNRKVFANQNQLAQLHDSERMAMTLMTDVIQSAGYFPDPTTNTITSTMTAGGGFAVQQAITGTYAAAVPGDTISVRYMTATGDGILNCSGGSNTSGANVLYVSKFQVLNGQLVCTMNGTQYNLVSGVTNSTTTLGVTKMTVLYGVKTNAAATGNTVDTYLNASQMSAANWNSVISVLVTLTFTNPLYVAPLQGQPATVSIQRVIGIMNQVGPSL